MPRNSKGVYTLPPGNPVITDTVIESNWANPTMADLGNALTNSLPRDGSAGMLGPLMLARDALAPMEATTKQQLDAATISASNFLAAGSYMDFAMNAIPAAYVQADGRELDRATFSDLFAAIGVIYGAGNGSTTFNIPDRRGTFARSLDSSRGLDPNRTLSGTAQTGSNQAHIHLATQAVHGHSPSQASHTHAVSESPHGHPTYVSPTSQSTFQSQTTGAFPLTTNGAGAYGANAGAVDAAPGSQVGGALTGLTLGTTAPAITETTASPAITVASEGGEARPVNMAVVTCIRLYGSYITGQLGSMSVQGANNVAIIGGFGNFTTASVATAPVSDNDVVRLVDLMATGGINSIVSSDSQVITINSTNPAAPIITPNTNVPYGMVKLNGAGQVDPAQIPLSDINYIGPWDASGGQTPSEANPTTTYIDGQMFQIDVSGTMTVIDSSGTPAPLLCGVGAQIIYCNNSSPTFPIPGWYLNPAPVLSGASAAQITLTPTGDVAATNVQDGIAELASEKATTASVTTVSNNLSTHVGNATGAHAASAISNSASGNITSTTVQAAINELDSAKLAVTGVATDSSKLGNIAANLYALIANVVTLVADQTIAGIKTFSSNPLSSAAQSTAANALTRKDYVDSKIIPARTWKTRAYTVNTTYTNNTGFEMFVALVPNSTGSITTMNIDGTERAYGVGSIYMPVPAGSTYIFPFVSGGLYRGSEFSVGS